MDKKLTRTPLDDDEKKQQDNADFKFNFVEPQFVAGLDVIPEFKNYKERAIEVYDDTTQHDKYVYIDKNDIDYNFLKLQYDFLKSLNIEEIGCLKLYSENGYPEFRFFHENKDNIDLITSEYDDISGFDVDTKNVRHGVIDDINKIFKIYDFEFNELGKMKDSYNKQSVYKLVSKYYETIVNIINKAPKTQKQIRLFRGVKGTLDKKLENLNGIVSTSYNPNVATLEDFINYPPLQSDKNCCLLEIQVSPGIPAIWVSPISSYRGDEDEHEILLYCNDNVKTIFSNPIPKASVRQGKIDSTGYKYNTYDVKLEVLSPFQPIIPPTTDYYLALGLKKHYGITTIPTSIPAPAPVVQPKKGVFSSLKSLFKSTGSNRKKHVDKIKNKKKTIRKRRNNRKTHRK